MKNFKILILLIILVIISSCKQKIAEEKSIKIGVILPLTGSGSDQGKWQMNGLELAKEEINSNGGINGKLIELIYEDSKGGNPKEAVSAYQKLRTEYNIPIVITWGSGVGIGLTELVNNDQVIQMGIATASPDYSTSNDFTFRVFPSSTAEGTFGANLIKNKLKFSKVAVIYVENDYGVGSKNSFIKRFKEIGGEIIAEEALEPNSADARTQVLKIKEENPEAVFLAVYPQEGGVILKQSSELDYKTQFIASTAILGGKELFDIAGSSADGLLVTTGQFDSDSKDPLIKSFAESYSKKYGTKPEVYSARAYDGLKVIGKVLSLCVQFKKEIDTNCLKDSLFSLKEYNGITGKISFDSNGDIIADFQILIAKDGKFVKYKT